MASVFSDFICKTTDEFVSRYTKYVTNYANDAAYKAFLREKRAEKKPLSNHLIMPIQRVTRYLLLLEELRDNVMNNQKRKELDAVIIRIVETVNMINEKQRQIENMSQCLQVQETINRLTQNIVESNRKLCAQLIFRKKKNQRKRQFFLFNDLLIICNLKLRVKAVTVLIYK